MTTKPEPATPPTVNPADELKAMGRIVRVLDELDRATQDRIAGWVYDRYRQPAEAA